MSTSETTSPTTGAPVEVATEQLLSMYADMVLARRFEERVHALFLESLVKGTSHLGIGQEAIAAGFAAAMRPGDLLFCTYRGHNHTLLRGAPIEGLLSELLGRAGGVCGGKGGSMHLTWRDGGAMGSYAIVGAHLPIAAGAAWAAAHRGTGQVVVCFFGDGATNIGAFHEALNLAAVWSLPVVFVCENNHYMEYTSIDAVTAVPHPAADRASAYGLEPHLLDGNDVEEVYRMAKLLLERARAGTGPALVEAETYRHGGHSRADPGDYRPSEEVERWLERDPLTITMARLEQRGVGTELIEEIDRSATERVATAEGEARRDATPAIDSAFVNVFADGGWAWRN